MNFDGFKRSLFIVAKTHECSDVLDPTYTPSSEPEEQELFEAKQTFMFSVFNTNLQTDMGKTIVRRHLASTDAQAVWKELSEHMKTSSKGASEKRDANLNHCLATGKSLTGCLHFVNKTPVDWYSKKQATVETAMYGSEFVAAKTATEQIMDIRQTLRYLGAPITTKSFLFGDNRSVVTSATLPHSTLTKRHLSHSCKTHGFLLDPVCLQLKRYAIQTLGPSFSVPNDIEIIDY